MSERIKRTFFAKCSHDPDGDARIGLINSTLHGVKVDETYYIEEVSDGAGNNFFRIYQAPTLEY